jgi:Phage P22-like portal protein
MAYESRHKRSKSLDDFLSLARDRFKQAAAADAKQRERERSDLAFYAGGENQWSDEQLKARKGQNASNGLPPVPARPTLTINKVRQPVQQVVNDIRDADFGIELVAADDWGELAGEQDDTEVQLREGLARRIQRASEAEDARLWAASRAAICGRGYYGVLTRYATGKTFDQEVYVHRFYNQASVSLDPAHEQPDGSDAEWGFVGTDLPWAQYQAEFPQIAGKANELAAASDDDFRALGEDYPDWFTTDGETKSCRVVDYWYTERTTRTLVQLADGRKLWKDELRDDDELLIDIVDERDVVEKKIQWCKLDGYQKLEETEWPGPDLPIVKVLGEELQPYDGERRAEGMVRPARDSQIGFNSMVSKWVETVGLAPIPPFQATLEQIEGFEQWYQQANTRTLPYLPYNAQSAAGQPLGPPTRTPVESPIAAIAASVQMFDEAIQSTTGVPDSRVGRNTDSHLKSGKAILALEQQSKHGTSNYRDNLRRSVRYEGQIINNLLYPIYGKTPGRMVRILTGEGESETVRIAAPPPSGNGNTAGSQPPAPMGAPPPMGPPGMPPQMPPGPPGLAPGGPMPPPGGPPMGGGPMMPPGAPQRPGMPPGMPGQLPPQAPKPVKEYRLTPDANFNVIVKVTRGFPTRRDEESSTIADLLNANPMFMGWFGDLFFKNQDGPGHQEMAERAKVMLDPKIQQLLAQKDGGPGNAQQLQQQLSQISEQLKHAEAALKQMDGELKGKQAEIQSKEQIAKMQLDGTADLQLALKVMDNAKAIAVAHIAAAAKGAAITQHADEEAQALGHEAVQADADRQHEKELTAQEHLQGLQAAQLGQDHALEQGQMGHEQTLEQGQQAAALQPPPTDPGLA